MNDPLDRRRAGVLLHPSSLPGGNLACAAEFLDLIRSAGLSVWQMLPVGPPGADGSPYFGASAFAGHTALIPTLGAPPAGARPIKAFAAQQAYWLGDYTLFTALGVEHGGVPWWAWPAALRDREPGALAAARRRLAEPIRRLVAAQHAFDQAWRVLRAQARERGVLLFGDVPIYVAPNSADVWAHRELFSVGEEGWIDAVAGVPPDYFAREGQYWGNPTYQWQYHAAEGYRWWIERLRMKLERFDLLRFDHFRGLEAYWEIPAGAATSSAGRWLPGPGADLLEAVRAALGRLPLVAEDLGVITPDVERLRDSFGLPGMRVLQFGFDGSPTNSHLPHTYPRHCVAYTGTHDNDTAAGWFAALDPVTRASVTAYLGCTEDTVVPAMVGAVLGSGAELAVVPAQDLLGLGSGARMNMPGSSGGNWAWRLAGLDALTAVARPLAKLNEACCRTA